MKPQTKDRVRRHAEKYLKSSSLNFNLERNIHLTEAVTIQQEIDKEHTILKANLEQLATSSQNWLKALKDLNVAVKELGDLENYAEIIELETKCLCDALV
jgi:GCN5-like protein 1 (GCN5L1)